MAQAQRRHRRKSLTFRPENGAIPGVVCAVPARGLGSSLKFCRLAEGAIDVYPRLGPTHEWDVAVGHAIITAAGGIVTAPTGGPLKYGNSDHKFLIAGFVAWGDPPRHGRSLSDVAANLNVQTRTADRIEHLLRGRQETRLDRLNHSHVSDDRTTQEEIIAQGQRHEPEPGRNCCERKKCRDENHTYRQAHQERVWSRPEQSLA